jgi:hypothetical protein
MKPRSDHENVTASQMVVDPHLPKPPLPVFRGPFCLEEFWPDVSPLNLFLRRRWLREQGPLAHPWPL